MRFLYKADHDLFRFLKKNRLFQVLKNKGLKMSFGWGGKMEIEPIAKKRTNDGSLTHFTYSYFGRFFKICLVPFDTGRVYINFWNHYEVIVEKFEDVIDAIDKLVNRYIKNEPQDRFELFYKMPEAKEAGKRSDEMKVKKKNKSKEVSFVSYDGKYPNLCSGILVLKVGDKEFVFPKYCLESGGSVWFSNGYADEHVENGEWSITDWPKDFPEELKEEAEKVVNDNVHQGCCGGCI